MCGSRSDGGRASPGGPDGEPTGRPGAPRSLWIGTRPAARPGTARRGKIGLVAFGAGLGALLSAGLLALAHLADVSRRRVTPGGREALEERLDRNPRALFMYDETLSYRLKPLFAGTAYSWRDAGGVPRVSPPGAERHVTNSLGLLGSEEPSADPAVRKVVFLGDSVAYGDGVPFSRNFVSRVAEAAGTGTQVFNGACPGWGTRQELLYFERFLRGTDWSLVVLAFVLNDLVNFEWVFDTGDRPRPGPEYRRLNDLLTEPLGVKAVRRRFAAQPQAAILNEHHNGFLLAWDDAAWARYRAEVLEPLLLPMRDRLLVVAIPTSLQLAALELGAPADLVLHPQRQMARFCGEHGIPYLDTSSAFPVRRPKESFQDDCHPTELGHELIAGRLAPALEGLLAKAAGGLPREAR